MHMMGKRGLDLPDSPGHHLLDSRTNCAMQTLCEPC